MIYENYENIKVRLYAERNKSTKEQFDVKIMYDKAIELSYTEQLFSLDQDELNKVMIGLQIQNKRKFGRKY